MRPSLTLRAMVGPRITRGGIVGAKRRPYCLGVWIGACLLGPGAGKVPENPKSKIQNPKFPPQGALAPPPPGPSPGVIGPQEQERQHNNYQVDWASRTQAGISAEDPPSGWFGRGRGKKVSFAPKGKNNFIDKPCFGIRIAPDGCGVLLRRLPRRGAVFFLSFSLLLCFSMALTTRYRFASPERVRAAAARSRRSAFLAFLAHPRQNNQRFLRVPDTNYPQQRDPKNPDARRYGDGRHHHLHQNDGRHGAKHAPRDRQRVSFFPLGR